MTGINSYSTTASENIQANTGVNWDEGMAPGAVNNSARQNMADLRAAFDDLIWFQYGIGSKAVAHAYASATSTTIAGADVTGIYHAGRRVKAVGSSTGTIYGAVSSCSYNSGTSTTTVNYAWDTGALANEALTLYLSQVPVTGNPAGLSGRNRLINGDFRINQRGYASAAALAAGAYGHDRWKAGSGGGDYSFTQNKSDTTITIASGKSLMQVVEDVNVEGGNYILSWSGTASARVAAGGGSTSGSYATGPLAISGASAGQTITVEFNAGTLGKVQLEPGIAATVFEWVDYGAMFDRCLRYCYVWKSGPTNAFVQVGFGFTTGSEAQCVINYPKPMRAPPSLTSGGTFGVTLYNNSNQNSTGVSMPSFSSGLQSSRLTLGGINGLTGNQPAGINASNDISAKLIYDAEI